jgi:hypothetical protein
MSDAKDKKDYRKDIPFSEIMDSVMDKISKREKYGIKKYGRNSYKKLDMFEEMEQELLDVMVYAYLEILKLRELADKKRNI